MSFPDRAESLRAKAHMSGTRLPVLVGITALALFVIVFVGVGIAHTLASNHFSVEKSETVQSGQKSLSSKSSGSLGSSEQNSSSSEQADPSSPGMLPDTTKVPVCVVVHVGGAVVEPGVYEVPEGSRLRDAIAAAGGFSDDAARDALNLARLLCDGEQVLVPTQEEYVNATAFSPQTKPWDTNAAQGKININTASAAELDTLPGIGLSTAEKIIANRTAQGLFTSPEDLKRVPGIGEKKYAALADLICTG